jgi:hypothetical protein
MRSRLAGGCCWSVASTILVPAAAAPLWLQSLDLAWARQEGQAKFPECASACISVLTSFI